MSESDELFCACLLGMGIFSVPNSSSGSPFEHLPVKYQVLGIEKWVVGTWTLFFLESASAKVSRNKFPQNLRQIHGPSVLHPTCYSARLLQGAGGKDEPARISSLDSRVGSIVVPFFFLHMQHFQELKSVKIIFCFSPTIEEYQKGHDISWCWGDLWVGDSQRCWWAAGNPRQHHQWPRRPQLDRIVWQWNWMQ